MMLGSDYCELLLLSTVPVQGVMMDADATPPPTRRKAKQNEEPCTGTVTWSSGREAVRITSSDYCQSTAGPSKPLAWPKDPPTGCGQTALSLASLADGSSPSQEHGRLEVETTAVADSPGLGRVPHAGSIASSAGPLVTGSSSSSSGASSAPSSAADEHYDFLVWHHEDSAGDVERIYNFLEEELHLRGYLQDRDGMPGQYALQEQHGIIGRCRMVLLLFTPRSLACGKFENQMYKSLNHSISRGLNNVVPIYCQVDRRHGPNVMQSIHGLQYSDCSDSFKTAIAKLFGIGYPPQQGKTPSGSSATTAKRSLSTKSEPSPSSSSTRMKRFFSSPWNKKPTS